MISVGDRDVAVNLSNELVYRDIYAYYGHLQSEFVIEPMLIILNQKFDAFMEQLNRNDIDQ